MTPTISEREARELLAREYESAGLAFDAQRVRSGDLLCSIEIRAIIAALTRQEAQGAVAEVAEGYCGAFPAVRFYGPPRERPKPGTKLYTAPPAPVDVRVEALRNRFLSETSSLPEEWQDWREDFRRDIQAILDGQPAGVDADPRIALFYEAVELQRTYYGDGAGLHLEMIDWAAKATALGGGGGRG